MMGEAQERWLAEQLQAPQATWQMLAQQVLFSALDWRSFPFVQPTDFPARDLDAWDGATAGRERVLRILRDSKVKNAVVLTGDLHMGLALEIKDDWRNENSACVGTEFLATSISSGGDGSASLPNASALYTGNPHLKFIGNERGYSRHIVTPQRWQADFRVIEKVTSPGLPVTTRKSFIVEAGHPGLMDA
jgi:alkaline phosphatase D